MSLRILRAAALAFVCLLAADLSPAQLNTDAASISGTVSDINGSVVAGATVTIANDASGRSATAVSDGNGRYAFTRVQAGQYSMTVVSDGFAPFTHFLTAGVGQSRVCDAVLTPSSVSATATVKGDDGYIETTRTQVAGSVTPREVNAFPLNGRNFVDLALLVPGVSRTNTGNVQRFAETSAVPGTGISVAGQRNLNNSFIVDGMSTNDDSVELAGTFYGQDVIREFLVVTNGAVAEFGRASGGFISIVTNSGTNDLRGRLYGYFRNQRLDARNPLAATRDPLTQTQYGGTLEGPLRHTRTFFFTNFEQTRRHDSNIVTISPANVAAINARLDALAFRGPRIETGLLPGGYTTTNVFGRIDHRLNNASDLAVTYNYYDIDAVNARTVGGLNALSRGTNLRNTDNTLNAQLVSRLGQDALNEMRFEYRRSRLGAPVIDAAGPAVNINGIANFGTAVSSPTRRDIDLFQFADAVTLVRSTHTIKTGAEFIYNDLNIDFPGAMQGVYTFNNLANFLSGNYSQYQQAFGAASQRQSNPNAGVFAQDEWHALRLLTLNLGVRYDLQFLPDPIHTDTNNISPRIGIAYAPDEKTVIRASAGIYYDRIPTRATSNALQRDGSKYVVAVFTPSTMGAPVFPNVLAAAPSILTIKPSITRIDPNIENSQSFQASVQVERELPGRVTASVGWMHLRATNLILSRNVNVPTCANAALNLCRPDPNYGNISRYESSGDSWYDGMVVSLNKQQGKWLNLRGSYTLSKSLDTSGNFFFSTPQDNANLRGEKGLSDNDQRHRLTFSGSVAHLPSLHGFEFGWIYTYASRLPFNILLGSDRNGDTNNNDRPIGAGRNIGRGFDYSSLDLRVSRRFRFNEHRSLELLIDGFNILNRSNFAVPNNVFGPNTFPVSTFGRPTAAFDPRQIQIGVRLSL